VHGTAAALAVAGGLAEELGELGLAPRPKTPMPRDWPETLLFRPVATSSAVFEAMGRTVAISGTIDIDPDRTCTFDNTAWPCGQRARAGAAMSSMRPRRIRSRPAQAIMAPLSVHSARSG